MYVKLDYDPDNPLPDTNSGDELQKKGLDRYLNAETIAMPAPSYFDIKMAEIWRQRAIIVIFNVAMRENLEPFIPYLAMNYFDRYASRDNYPLPLVMKRRQHNLELLCVCCLTLACKMRDKEFSSIEFRERHPGLADVTPEKLLAMELCILKGIDWHLRAVTPLCFVQLFAPEFDTPYGFRRQTINQIIMHAQNDFRKTRFRPSVMAASAFLAASSFLYPERLKHFFEKMISHEIFIEGDLLECMKCLIRQCNELETLIESAVEKNEYVSRKKVRAGGEISEDKNQVIVKIDIGERSRPSSGPSGQATGTSDAAEYRPAFGEISVQATAGKKLKEESIRAAANEGAESSGEIMSKGKEKVSEAERGTMVDECEDLQMGFVLRWRLGEMNWDNFRIFSLQTRQGKGHGRRRDNQLRKFCCFCSPF